MINLASFNLDLEEFFFFNLGRLIKFLDERFGEYLGLFFGDLLNDLL